VIIYPLPNAFPLVNDAYWKLLPDYSYADGLAVIIRQSPDKELLLCLIMERSSLMTMVNPEITAAERYRRFDKLSFLPIAKLSPWAIHIAGLKVCISII
jgi:hypothetical protein